MADVQIEKGGFLRIANRLEEAITYASFSATHLKIVRALIRLSYGWQKRTVRIGVPELAAACNLRPSSGFRLVLAELITERVVFEVQHASGRRASLYAVNKNFEDWGRFVVHPARLEALFSKRPQADDDALDAFLGLAPHRSRSLSGTGQDTEDDPDQIGEESEGDSLPSPGQSTQADDAVSIDGSVPRTRQSTADRDEPLTTLYRHSDYPVQDVEGPVQGSQTPRKSLNGETLQGWKDKKDKKDITPIQAPTTNLRVPAGDARAGGGGGGGNSAITSAMIEQFAVGMSTAANAAIRTKFGDQPDPMHWRTGLESARLLLEKHVDLDVARSAIARAIERSKSDRPPKTLAWFYDAIVRAHESVEQRRLNAEHPDAPAEVRGGEAVSIANLLPNVTGGAERREEDNRQHAAYDIARQRAAHAWAKVPANDVAYRQIVLVANTQYEGFLEKPFGRQMRDAAIVLACEKLCGFPPFEQWLAARAQAPPEDPEPRPGADGVTDPEP